MKQIFFLVIVFFSFVQISNAQADTNKIYNCNQLKKGFYKSYEEYINNSPSNTLEFNTILLSKSKSDSTIIGAEYKLLDSSLTVKNIWGFCDGNSVYVKYSRSILWKKFWKLECIGPVPFFTFKMKDIVAVGPGILTLATAAVSASMPSQYIPMLIDEKGKFKQFDIPVMRKLLKNHPDLLKSFRSYTDRYSENSDEYESEEVYEQKIKIIKDFLIMLNGLSKNETNNKA